jgi:hypothetical protein
MGYAVKDIPYIGLAEKLGVGVGDPRKAIVRELSPPEASSGGDWKPPFQPGFKVKQFAPLIREEGACSACYAALIFALSRMSRNETGRIQERLCIGQGFQGKKGHIGIGRCTAGFTASSGGCPPGGADILTFLREQARN